MRKPKHTLEYWQRRNKHRYEKKKATAREFVLMYKKTHSCQKCSESDWRCLDFHHRDPETKIAGVAAMVSAGKSLDSIREEISKCDIHCANCHRKLSISK